ncbi:MAG TPA: hypothetical protein VF615_06460 [Longimicrobiaceae bacterium]|jgi:hypothetical protein
MRKSLALAVALCTFAPGLARPAAAQAPDAAPARAAVAPFASGSTPLSLTTTASWYLGGDPVAGRSLALLVLWRGAPNWAAGVGGAGTSGGAEDGPIRQWRRSGTALTEWETDPARRIVRVAGREVALGDDNVLLVDSADGTAGPPRVVGTARIASPGSLTPREVHAAVLRAVQADSALARFIR